MLRNLKVRHAAEHDIYVLESDGYLLDRFKTFYAGEYGVLTFVEDHGLMQNCEAAGNGDSGLYPGAGADTGHQRDTEIYPKFRYSQEIRYCDSHHNTSGYSGTDGNADPRPPQQLLRQRARLHDRRLHGARATPASRRTRT